MTTEKRTVAPDMNWLAEGKEDPHPTYVNQTRENLTLADYTDDELANAVYMSGDISREEDTQRMMAAHKVGARYISKIALLTAAKERIRWLTRRLAVAEGRYPGISKPAAESDVMVEGLKSAAHKMLETDPSRGLPQFKTITEATNSMGDMAGIHAMGYKEEDGSFELDGYFDPSDLEAILFIARVHELAKPLGLSINIKEVDVNQLRQVALPNTQVTDIDSSILSSPVKDHYFHSDRAVNAEGVVTRNKHGLSGITKDQLTDSYLDDLQDLGLLSPESRSAAKSLLKVPLKDSRYGEFERWKKSLSNPEGHAESGMILGAARDKTIIVSGHTARELSRFNGFEPVQFPEVKPIPRKNRFSPFLGDHEGDSMLPKRLSNRGDTNPRQNAFASTALGKLLARALPNRAKGETETYLKPEHIARAEEILRKEEVLGFGPTEYYPIKLPDDSQPLRHNPNRLTGESEMATENDRYAAGSLNLNKTFGKLGSSDSVLADKGDETEHLLSSEANAERLRESAAAFKEGKGVVYPFDQSKFTQTDELGGRGVAVPVEADPNEEPAPKMINFGKEGDCPDLNPEWTQWFMQLHSLPVLAAKSAAVNVLSNTLTMVRGRFNENKPFSDDEKQLLEGLGFMYVGRHAFIIETLDDIIQDIQFNSGL